MSIAAALRSPSPRSFEQRRSALRSFASPTARTASSSSLVSRPPRSPRRRRRARARASLAGPSRAAVESPPSWPRPPSGGWRRRPFHCAFFAPRASPWTALYKLGFVLLHDRLDPEATRSHHPIGALDPHRSLRRASSGPSPGIPTPRDRFCSARTPRVTERKRLRCLAQRQAVSTRSAFQSRRFDRTRRIASAANAHRDNARPARSLEPTFVERLAPSDETLQPHGGGPPRGRARRLELIVRVLPQEDLWSGPIGTRLCYQTRRPRLTKRSPSDRHGVEKAPNAA